MPSINIIKIGKVFKVISSLLPYIIAEYADEYYWRIKPLEVDSDVII